MSQPDIITAEKLMRVAGVFLTQSWLSVGNFRCRDGERARESAWCEVIAGWEKSAVGLSSGRDYTGDLRLRRLLDGAQFVLNHGPVFSAGLFMWTLTLSLLCTALSAVLKRRIRCRSVPLSRLPESIAA